MPMWRETSVIYINVIANLKVKSILFIKYLSLFTIKLLFEIDLSQFKLYILIIQVFRLCLL